MSSTCISYKNHSNTIIQLICDHYLCLQFAQNIKIPQGLPPLDAKFKIKCPVYRKSTTTLNILNLVKKNNEKVLFANIIKLQQPKLIESKEQNQSKLRRMSYTSQNSQSDRSRKTVNHQRKTTRQSQQARRKLLRNQMQYPQIMFYCKQEAMLMCMQCIYKNMKQKKNHNVSSVSDSIGTIISHNKQFKLDARKKIDQIDKCISICKSNKSKIDQACEIYDQLIKQNFKNFQN